MSDSKRERERLVPESHTVRDPDAMTIIVRYTNSDPVVAFLSDSTGLLVVHTFFGTYAHQWSTKPEHLGHPTLSDFLVAQDRTHYVVDKLMYGKERTTINIEQTRDYYVARIKDMTVDEATRTEMLEEAEEFDWGSFPHGHAPMQHVFDPTAMAQREPSLAYLRLLEDIVPAVLDGVRVGKQARIIDDDAEARPAAKA